MAAVTLVSPLAYIHDDHESPPWHLCFDDEGCTIDFFSKRRRMEDLASTSYAIVMIWNRVSRGN